MLALRGMGKCGFCRAATECAISSWATKHCGPTIRYSLCLSVDESLETFDHLGQLEML